MIMKLWALWALAGTASALLPVIVPMSDNTNDTQLTWGPVTADISANRCRAFAVAFEGGKKQEMVVTVEDSNKGLNYVAAGVGRYNNKEVVGSPAILSYGGVRTLTTKGGSIGRRPYCPPHGFHNHNIRGSTRCRPGPSSRRHQVGCHRIPRSRANGFLRGE